MEPHGAAHHAAANGVAGTGERGGAAVRDRRAALRAPGGRAAAFAVSFYPLVTLCSTQVRSIASQSSSTPMPGLVGTWAIPWASMGYGSFIGNRNGSSGTSSSKYSQFAIAQLT